MGDTRVSDKVTPPFSCCCCCCCIRLSSGLVPFFKLRGNLSKSQDDATAWGLLDFVITSHPYGHGLSGLRPPGSFEGSGTNGLSLCTTPNPRLHSATTCLHLTPIIQSHVAQHPRTIKPLEQTKFRGRQLFTLTSFTC